MTFIESVYDCVYHENVIQIMFIFQETKRVVWENVAMHVRWSHLQSASFLRFISFVLSCLWRQLAYCSGGKSVVKPAAVHCRLLAAYIVFWASAETISRSFYPR